MSFVPSEYSDHEYGDLWENVQAEYDKRKAQAQALVSSVTSGVSSAIESKAADAQAVYDANLAIVRATQEAAQAAADAAEESAQTATTIARWTPWVLGLGVAGAVAYYVQHRKGGRRRSNHRLTGDQAGVLTDLAYSTYGVQQDHWRNADRTVSEIRAAKGGKHKARAYGRGTKRGFGIAIEGEKSKLAMLPHFLAVFGIPV